MKKYLSIIAMLWLATTSFAQVPNVQNYSAGYEQLRITDEARKRPIHLDIWYPTTTSEKEYNYGLSKGSVASGLIIANKQFPIILLSHGSMGSASNYSWLAEYLARCGYVVLGVSHFGESVVFGFDTVDSASVTRFGDRTKDLNFALEFLVDKSKFAVNIDSNRIAAVGHSAGGASVLMLNGTEFSRTNLINYCQKASSADDKGCAYPRGIETDKQRTLPTNSSHIFKALVMIDPAIGQGFTKKGLKSTTTPTLIIGSVKNDFLPYNAHAGYLSSQIKKAEIIKLDNGEGHFVYLDECKLPIKVMGIPLCTDRDGVDRKSVHLKLAIIIEKFLSRQLLSN